MAKKRSRLQSQIRRSVETDTRDTAWHDHFAAVAESLALIGPMPPLHLLTQEGAREAAALCAEKLLKINQTLKQVNAVKQLAQQEKAELELKLLSDIEEIES